MGRNPRTPKKPPMTKQEILQEKLHKEPLTASDVKTIFNLDKDTFEAWMLRMREIYEELNAISFKKGKYYDFKPDWQSPYLVLFGAVFDHPRYHRDISKQDVSMEGRSKYLKKLKEGMEKYMTDDEKLEIKATPSYIRSEVETLLVDEINKKIARISATIQMMPEDLRFRVLAGVNESMETWNLHLSQMTANHLMKTAMDERSLDDKTKHEMRAYRRPLDHMLAEQLKWAVERETEWRECEKEIDAMTSDTEEEQAFINALYKELIIEPWRATAGSEIWKMIEETRKTILKEPSNAAIVKKVLEALEGVDDSRAQIIRVAMEQALITVQVADEESSKSRAEIRKSLDKLMYDHILSTMKKK